jgi:hypothetical protein
MAIYVFTSRSAPALRGFTSDEAGENLPAMYAPWQKLVDGASPALAHENHPIARAVLRHGFFVISARNYARPQGVAA